MAKTFKEKKKKVTSVQWNGDNINEIREFVGKGSASVSGNALVIQTSHAAMTMNKSDYLVKDGDNLSPMIEKDFNEKYKEVSE